MPSTEKSLVPLGDPLLAEIVRLVQDSPVTPISKARALARAGKIGEMYLGVLGGDGALQRAFSSSSEELPSPERG